MEFKHLRHQKTAWSSTQLPKPPPHRSPLLTMLQPWWVNSDASTGLSPSCPWELGLTISWKAFPTLNSKCRDHFQPLNPNISVTSCLPAYVSCPILPKPCLFFIITITIWNALFIYLYVLSTFWLEYKIYKILCLLFIPIHPALNRC